jgi:putative redox protein
MSKTKITLTFDDSLAGTLDTGYNQVNIGRKGLRPYEMLLGALGSCYYYTFLDIINKMRLHYRKITMEIEGEKREEVPTHLKTATIYFTVEGIEDEDKAAKAAELSQKYCSIYYTLSQVAELSVKMKFIP